MYIAKTCKLISDHNFMLRSCVKCFDAEASSSQKQMPNYGPDADFPFHERPHAKKIVAPNGIMTQSGEERMEYAPCASSPAP